MKDNREEHLEFVHHNVVAHDMNEGKMEYTKVGEGGIEYLRESFSFLYFAKGSSMGMFLYKKHLGADFPQYTIYARVGKST